MKLKTKLLIIILLVGTLPLFILGVITLNKSTVALEHQAFNELEAVREIKKAEVEDFFKARQHDMDVLVDLVASLKQEGYHKLEAAQELKMHEVEKGRSSGNGRTP